MTTVLRFCWTVIAVATAYSSGCGGAQQVTPHMSSPRDPRPQVSADAAPRRDRLDWRMRTGNFRLGGDPDCEAQVAVDATHLCVASPPAVECETYNSGRYARSSVDVSGCIRDLWVDDGQVCALTSDDDLYCWAWDSSGNLLPYPGVRQGVLHYTMGNWRCWVSESRPAEVACLLRGQERRFSMGSEIVALSGHCALLAGGELYCWGDDTRCERAGACELEACRGPSRIPLFAPATVVGASNGVCVAMGRGGLACWGFPESALFALDRGTHCRDRVVDLERNTTDPIIALSVSNYFACGRTSDRLVCWGTPAAPQLRQAGAGWSSTLTLSSNAVHDVAVYGSSTRVVVCWTDDEQVQCLDSEGQARP